MDPTLLRVGSMDRDPPGVRELLKLVYRGSELESELVEVRE